MSEGLITTAYSRQNIIHIPRQDKTSDTWKTCDQALQLPDVAQSGDVRFQLYLESIGSSLGLEFGLGLKRS